MSGNNPDKSDPRYSLTNKPTIPIEGQTIATGGMGIVIEAFDAQLQRKVALKKPSPKLPPEWVESVRGVLIEEAQITAQLDHPNIVAVHELGVDESDEIFFTMKLVGGKELGQILKEKSVEDRTSNDLFDHLQIFLKVCDTVAFAHSAGVAHRDLKPANIMVGDFGTVYVMDWGLARKMGRLPLLDEDTVTTDEMGSLDPPRDEDIWATAGTLWYMSPEQSMGLSDEIDERTDVFLLGGILYEILTHFPPYEARTKKEIKAKAADAIIAPPDERVEVYLPSRLCNIAMKALRKRKQERYQSVLELKQEVEKFIQGGGQFQRQIYAEGSLIIREGEQGSEAYIIISGKCRAFKTVDGKKVYLREMGPGEVFGEIAVLTNEARTASVEAIEPIKVQVVTREDFEEELGMGVWLSSIIKILAERFKEKDARLIELEKELERVRQQLDD